MATESGWCAVAAWFKARLQQGLHLFLGNFKLVPGSCKNYSEWSVYNFEPHWLIATVCTTIIDIIGEYKIISRNHRLTTPWLWYKQLPRSAKCVFTEWLWYTEPCAGHGAMENIPMAEYWSLCYDWCMLCDVDFYRLVMAIDQHRFWFSNQYQLVAWCGQECCILIAGSTPHDI